MLRQCHFFNQQPHSQAWLLAVIIVLGWATTALCMTGEQIVSFKQDARYIFYHGLSNYFKYAWPEDELRPITCGPMTRDRVNPGHFEVNDALGNYSLSMVDSLSTLAILASSPTSDHDDYNALEDFQKYIRLLVEQYGDGSEGPAGEGERARGFDLDSKVQLFETTIRGVGGLLSAHLFAIGDLPIRGYTPVYHDLGDGREGILWNSSTVRGTPFVYDGQLLRLALDLGKRLLPAFHTPTSIPYPRVNLRTGIPFYQNSPLNNDAEHGQCDAKEVPKDERETVETCSAGAGSLVLEFTVLSRLTGDDRFEVLAKKAFWAVWQRRASTGLIGSGIDAETAEWMSGFTGIGAGIDSFFEYAFKSHVLLSGLENEYKEGDEDVSSLLFLEVWNMAHAAIKRHVYRGPQFKHPHYAQNDMWTGGARLAWVDSLSAYYPGLLTLAGELEEATAAQLLYTALWTRYGAIPERWNTYTGFIDGGLGWWAGRPEFIESNWYLYRATKDPWYLHVGEMAIKDINRRCWTACGWAGLQDVKTGELSDRMESFFLGETAKYLYLLFDEGHPLNHLDAPFVFSTEGHPLIIPTRYKPSKFRTDADPVPSTAQCPAPPALLPFSISAVASRDDIFHASSLVRLHEEQATATWQSARDYERSQLTLVGDQPAVPYFYPWTLPSSLVPALGTSSKMTVRQTFDLTFPTLPGSLADLGMLQRVDGGILMKSFSGLRLALVLDENEEQPEKTTYRISALSGLNLGRDESLWMTPKVLSQLNPTDPHLLHVKDTDVADLFLDIPVAAAAVTPKTNAPDDQDIATQLASFLANPSLDLASLQSSRTPGETLLRALPKVLFSDGARLADQLDSFAELSLSTSNLNQVFRQAASDLRNRYQPPPQEQPKPSRSRMPAMLPYGPGSGPLDSTTTLDTAAIPPDPLALDTILVLDDPLCSQILPPTAPRQYKVLVLRRGSCSFSEKLAQIPTFPPLEGSLKLVVVVGRSEDDPSFVHRPYLNDKQVGPAGVERRNAIPLVLLHGGQETWEGFVKAASAIGTVEHGELKIKETGVKGGVAVKRRVWFACNGVKIANLHVA